MFKSIKVENEKGKTLNFRLSSFEEKIILNEVFFSKNYFPKINKEQDFSLKENDVIIDIGAQVGVFSAYAASMAKRGKVYAFEPVKENFKRLEYHKDLNKLTNLTLINKGVSDKDKRIKMYLAQENTGGHSLNRNKFKSLHEVVRGFEMVEPPSFLINIVPSKPSFDLRSKLWSFCIRSQLSFCRSSTDFVRNLTSFVRIFILTSYHMINGRKTVRILSHPAST